MTHVSTGSDAAGLVAGFNDAFDRGDLDAVMAMMTPDCVFESTTPPEGERFSGSEAVRRCFQEFFAQTRNPSFTIEETIVAADRAVVSWRFAWTEDDGSPGHVRGVDLLTVRDGRVAEKRSYVKG